MARMLCQSMKNWELRDAMTNEHVLEWKYCPPSYLIESESQYFRKNRVDSEYNLPQEFQRKHTGSWYTVIFVAKHFPWVEEGRIDYIIVEPLSDVIRDQVTYDQRNRVYICGRSGYQTSILEQSLNH